MNKRFCRFNATVTKAYINPESGLKTIEAIASDNKLDWYEERFAEGAIDDMVYASRQRKELKPEEGLVGLQESHWEVFELGYAVDAMKVINEKNNSKEYKVVLALKEGWPQADELYKDIKENRINKQLSVGGFIPNFDEDYEVAMETFTNEVGDDVEIEVGIIKRFKLEHIAITIPDGAANPRTQFITAKSKGYKDGVIYRSANDNKYQELFKVKNEVSNEKSLLNILKDVSGVVKETMLNVFKEREDGTMKKVEKAKKSIEELKKLMADNSEEFTEEVIKNLGISFISEEKEEEKEVNVEEVVKEKIDALEAVIDGKIEEIKKSIPEKVEIPEIPEDNSNKVKSLEATIEALELRLKAIEDADTGTQAVVVKSTEEEEEEEEEVIVPDPNDKLAAWR